jgi:hypothetical protein
VSNNAKYAAVFRADSDHPFGRTERFLDLFVVLGWYAPRARRMRARALSSFPPSNKRSNRRS